MILAPHSPSPQEFEISPTRKYISALKVEHSRDLYLQGAMAVGQIVDLLEELCMNEGPEGIEVTENPAVVSAEGGSYSTSVDYQQRECIEAWAQDVALAPDPEDEMISAPGAAFEIQGDAEETYLSGCSVVADIADILEGFVNDIYKNKPEQHSQGPQPQPAQVETVTFVETADDLVLRIGNLSARLDRLGIDIDEFSNQRCRALAMMDTELANEKLDSFASGDVCSRLYAVGGSGLDAST